MSTSCKQPKMNRYQSSKFVPITNSFEGLEEDFDDENNNINIMVEKTIKPPPIFLTRINNFSSLQHLKEVAFDEYEIKIMNEQIKIHPSSSIAYVNIMKELKSRNREFTHINQEEF